ncbi:NAD-dependent protein deacetylase [Marinobacterium sediminicola]|uniref:NAD-dependent protein deacetylase n=1 Tax=Marinobacterium sediminicola TaxID=518898 RepID=A0ABY1S1J8_9GAMM|nr:NAD-dependent protein deacetylase [Marinobacterium sediminicola]ULG69405.1 NAD-dependent protein deacetylase [Marinobacterium sediminicola]SMR75554.1 NAD-dependent protein deacetylase, SIR2 family [Marinobacterium sediminicola]
MLPTEPHHALSEFIHNHPRLLILTGAGISTDSGIPDYRDRNGEWKRKQPVQHPDFMRCEHTRKRYWGRSLVGWPVMRDARPNQAHAALAQLEQHGHIELLVTQNVDGLHQRAGSARVIDLHGRSDRVICMSCDFHCSRDDVHQRSAELNPAFTRFRAETAPDGDADLEVDFSGFHIPDCPQCGGILKPDVVFFGDNVPKQRVIDALGALESADGLLVIGSSLMVYSGFRFCRRASEWNKPIAALTLGKTRADELLSLKLDAPIAPVLQATLKTLTSTPG